jgi:hypothetical protein
MVLRIQYEWIQVVDISENIEGKDGMCWTQTSLLTN